jgi:hypothetical protein
MPMLKIVSDVEMVQRSELNYQSLENDRCVVAADVSKFGCPASETSAFFSFS